MKLKKIMRYLEKSRQQPRSRGSMAPPANAPHRRFDLVNVEPYTSELYSTLFEPSVKTLGESYLHRVRHVLTRDALYKALLLSAGRGVLSGVSRCVFTVAMHNLSQDYRAQSKSERPPIDIFFLKYYTTPSYYPRMFRGLTTELKIEVPFYMCRDSLATFAKYVVPSKSDSILTNIGISLGRSFVTHCITAVTVYPMSLYTFGKLDTETLLSRTMHKAGSGSIKAALVAVGMQLGTSIFPSYRKLLKFSVLLLGG
jgi:hypothetical protein